VRTRLCIAALLATGLFAASAVAEVGHTVENTVVLGSARFAAPFGSGFGDPEPEVVSNGGVPSGTMEEITWTHWEERVAYGRGLGHQYKPRGGYYRHPVQVRLRAERIGECKGTIFRAYTRLRVKFQKKPGGAWDDWFLWSGARSLCEPLFDD